MREAIQILLGLLFFLNLYPIFAQNSATTDRASKYGLRSNIHNNFDTDKKANSDLLDKYAEENPWVQEVLKQVTQIRELLQDSVKAQKVSDLLGKYAEENPWVQEVLKQVAQTRELLKDSVKAQKVSVIDSIIITPPRKRRLNPNTFPTFVFTLYNNSNIRIAANFKLLLPRDWAVITFKYPSFIEPQKKERLRVTFTIPKNASADSTYKAGLVTEWESFSDTSFVEININPKPALRLITFIEEKHIVPGKIDSLSYVMINDGNVRDTFLLNAELPKDWDIIELVDKLILSPQQKEPIDLLIKAPKSTAPGTRSLIVLAATSLAAKNKGLDVSDKKSTRIITTEIKKLKPSRSLHPTLPINIGFAVNSIEKGRYPGINFFANTGVVKIADYTTQFEITQRLNSVPLEETPEMNTERIKFELASQKWTVSLGDVLIESYPLFQRTIPLSLTGYQPRDIIVRGGGFKYNFDKAYVSLFHGNRIYTDEPVFSTTAGYKALEKLEISSTYLRKDNSHLATMEGVFDTRKNSSLGALAGISKSNEDGKSYGGSAQFLAITKIKSLDLVGRLHWGGKTYIGEDRGRYGAVISSKWLPKPYIYLWGHLHNYKENLSVAQSASHVFVNDLRTRALFHPGNWPILNFGLDIRRESFSGGGVGRFNSFDFQIRKQLKYGMPSIYLELEDRYNPIYNDQQKRNELRTEWISYFKRSRFRLAQRFIREDSSPTGYVSDIDMNFSFHDIMLGFFISYGKMWFKDREYNYTSRRTSNIAVRSDFTIKPFGKNLNFRLEVGKSNAPGENWRIWTSISTTAGGVSRFYLPVPIVKTKGKILGEIFIDKNENGIRDAYELGLPNILLFLKDQDAMTDGDGKFEFPPLDPGEYSFSVDIATLPAYLEFTKEVPKNISIRKGSVIYLQVPISSICSINGRVFQDENNNGRIDAKEEGLALIRVVLHDQKDQEWEAYTDRDGNYKITDLLPGVYTLLIDSAWLPKRTIPGKTESVIVLSQEKPQQKVDLAVLRKKLPIKKTFTAPKNK